MLLRTLGTAVFLLVFSPAVVSQISVYPFRESFESVPAGTLQADWKTTNAKNTSGDFKVDSSSSSAHTGVKFLVSSDAKTPQSLISPSFDFQNKIAGQLEFYERRTSTYTAGVILEASIDGDTTFSTVLSDTLRLLSATAYVKRVVSLPPALSHHTNVRIRWRCLGNGASTAGIYRIDDISIGVAKSVDLALAAISGPRFFERTGSALTLTLSIKNLGESGPCNFRTVVMDSCWYGNRQLADTGMEKSLASGDSIMLSFTVAGLRPGKHRITGRLSAVNDEDVTNDTASFYTTILPRNRSVLINEIMYAPSNGPEWVECMNISLDTLDLADWKISDLSSRVTLTTQSFIVHPKEYFLISKDSAIAEYYPSCAAGVLRTSLPSLGNTKDAVVLLDPSGYFMDSVQYDASWGGTGGTSLERIDTAVSSTQSSNWGSSRHPLGATPGMSNSLSPKDFDAALMRLTIEPRNPVVNSSILMRGMIKNNGRCPAQNIRLSVECVQYPFAFPAEGCLIEESTAGVLMPGDSTEVSLNCGVLKQGEYGAAASVSFAEDEDTTNNHASLRFSVGCLPHCIAINEIMYAPTDEAPEWVECYNRTNSWIDIGGWKISDAGTSQRGAVHGPQTRVAPHSFFLLTADSTLYQYVATSVPVVFAAHGAFNNTTPDAVVLYDNRDIVMDSVWYRPSWGGVNGTSLQRSDDAGGSCDSANWYVGVPSPGMENDFARKDTDMTLLRTWYERSGGGILISATAKNIGRTEITGVTMSWYHDRDRDSLPDSDELVHAERIATRCVPGDSLIIHWQPDTIGVGIQTFLAVAAAEDDQRQSNNVGVIRIASAYRPQSIIINEIMYNPRAGCAEYVELYNRSADTISLEGWRLADSPSASGSRTTTMFQAGLRPKYPGEYFVIAKDSVLCEQFPGLADSQLCAARHDLGLGNDGDDVVLYDQTGSIVDSVCYVPSWHLAGLVPEGRSLERINPDVFENTGHTWSSCVDPAGGTPGNRNSIFTQVVPSAGRLHLFPNPFSPDNDGIEDMLGISYELPTAVALLRVRCFDITGRLVRTLAEREASASTGTIFWDGLDDYRQRVRIGMYVILFEALDGRGNAIRTLKEVAVVAGKL
ncbi:MAG: lamin tail domain-containing protein [Ignavibacteriales bacterium]|nr:lamin tail domain-containing protein [Ignavibacteriales bacterium]